MKNFQAGIFFSWFKVFLLRYRQIKEKHKQNKEAKSSAPARAVAFCFAKQGGLYEI